MRAFNRRFEPSLIVFLPPSCVVGAVLCFIGCLMAFLLSQTPIRLLGGLMICAGSFGVAFGWIYRNDANLIKTYSHNSEDRRALALPLRKGSLE